MVTVAGSTQRPSADKHPARRDGGSSTRSRAPPDDQAALRARPTARRRASGRFFHWPSPAQATKPVAPQPFARRVATGLLIRGRRGASPGHPPPITTRRRTKSGPCGGHGDFRGFAPGPEPTTSSGLAALVGHQVDQSGRRRSAQGAGTLLGVGRFPGRSGTRSCRSSARARVLPASSDWRSGRARAGAAQTGRRANQPDPGGTTRSAGRRRRAGSACGQAECAAGGRGGWLGRHPPDPTEDVCGDGAGRAAPDSR